MPNETVVNSVAISSDGEMLAVGQQSEADDKPALTFWEFTTEGIEKQDYGLCFEEAFMLQNLNFCDRNRYLVFNNILVFDLQLKKFIGNEYDIEYVEFINASGLKPYLLVSGSEIRVIDIVGNTIIWSYRDEIKFSTVNTPVTIANVSEDFERVVVAGGDTGEIIIFKVKDNTVIKRLPNGPAMAGKVVISNDFKYILATGYFGQGVFQTGFEGPSFIQNTA